MYFIVRKELLKLACLQFNGCRRLLSTTHLKSSLQNLITVISKLTRTLLQKVCEIIQQLKNRITGVSSVLEENNILSRIKYELPYLMAGKHQHREPIGSNHGQNLFVNRFLQADGKSGSIFHP